VSENLAKFNCMVKVAVATLGFSSFEIRSK